MNNDGLVINGKYTGKTSILINNEDALLFSSVQEDDGIVKPLVKYSDLTTKDFLKRLKNDHDTSFTNMILPNGTRLYNRNDKNAIFVIEQTPQIRTIRVNRELACDICSKRTNEIFEKYKDKFNVDQEDITFNLSFPFIIYVFSYDLSSKYPRGMRVYFRLHPISGLGDYLIKVPLSNIDQNGFVCLGSMGNTDLYNKSIKDVSSYYINLFWTNSFNSDYLYNITEYQNIIGVRSFIEWEENTKINPMFLWKDISWIHDSNNLEKVTNLKTVEYNMNFNNLKDLFYFTRTPAQQTENDKITYESRTDTVYLGDNRYVAVGDEIKYENKKQFIYSFYYDKMNAVYMSLIDENGNITSPIKMTLQLKEILLKDIAGIEYLDKVEINGKIVSKNDILLLKIAGGMIYKKCIQIKRTRDGFIAIKSDDNNILILDHIDFEVVDTNNIKVNDRYLEKNKEYIIYYPSHKSTYFMPYLKAKYTGLTINNNVIKLQFADNGYNERIIFNLSDINGKYEFLEQNEFEEDLVLYPYFRLGSTIFTNIDKTSDKQLLYSKKYNCFIWDLYGTNIFNTSSLRKLEHLFNINSFRDAINKDMSKLFIPGIDHDINLNIGDLIAISDWDNIQETYKVRKITGMFQDDEYFKIICENVDNSEDIRILDYIDYKNKIMCGLGRIRKITTNCSTFNRGDNVKAKVSGLLGFPKKNIQKILYFITDCPNNEPLVVFSNLKTMWFNNLRDNFEITTKDINTEYKYEIKSGDMLEYKQSGDLISKILLLKDNHSSEIRCYDLNGMLSFITNGHFYLSYYYTQYTKLFGFQNPRPLFKSASTSRTNYPSFHNTFKRSDNISYSLQINYPEDLCFQ